MNQLITRTMPRTALQFAVAIAAFALMIVAAPPANALIVNNGGFESGDLLTVPGWTQTGNTGFAGVTCGAGVAAEGNCAAFFGPIGSIGGIQQVLNLVIGNRYLLTFAFRPDGGSNPSFFSAILGGVTLVSLTNPVGTAYQNFSFSVIATAATETLAFNFRDDPGFLFLDAVSVSLPEPGSMGLLAIGFAALLLMGLRRKV